MLLGAATIAIAGCAAQPPAPQFSGPWAAEFAEAYRTTNHEFVREVLSDGVVSDEEYAEMWSNFVGCLSDAGFTVSKVEPGGGYQTDLPASKTPDQAHETDIRCSEETGEPEISSLYWWVRQNPEHRDGDEVMIECLTKAGVLPPGYGVDDYASQKMTGHFEFTRSDEGFAAFNECAKDPLGLLQ